MKKFVLVIFIMMVLAINICGIVKEISIEKDIQEANDEVATVVYME